MATKSTSYFDEKLDEIYDLAKVLNEKGEYSGECRYLKIVAVIALFICEHLRAIRFTLGSILGALLGLIVTGFITSLIK